MLTAAVMVSVGPRSALTERSFPRLARWATRHSYASVLIKHRLGGSDRSPHYSKLLVPSFLPMFDRWVIVDDDLLIRTDAPPLPDLPDGLVGLVPDAVQTNTTRPGVNWTGNTGFIMADRQASSLLEAAYHQGDAQDIWGPYDQGALNSVCWAAGRVTQLDSRWNLAPVVKFFHTEGQWHRWQASRTLRAVKIASMMLGFPRSQRREIDEAWGLHLIHSRRYIGFFDRRLP